MAEAQEPVQVPVVFIGAEDTPLLYANQFVIAHQGQEFILSVGQVTPPLLLGTPEQQYEQAKQLFNIKFSHKVIVGQIVKGGTGKTTTIDNVASCANTYGARVLKIDADPQGNLTDACGIDAEEKPVLIDVITEGINIKDAID